MHYINLDLYLLITYYFYGHYIILDLYYNHDYNIIYKQGVNQMSKYNKSQIMKSAWNLVKGKAITISEALKQAWSEFKANLVIDDKTVILTKLNHSVVRETEKAIQIQVGVHVPSKSGDGYYTNKQNVWVPKSAITKLTENTSKLANWFVAKNFIYGISCFSK